MTVFACGCVVIRTSWHTLTVAVALLTDRVAQPVPVVVTFTQYLVVLVRTLVVSDGPLPSHQ